MLFFQKKKITYYPRLDKTDVEVNKAIDLTPYIRYSEENEEALAKFCKKVYYVFEILFWRNKKL